ncbi:MAG TPA: hypothetical protein VFE33_34305 [Thermoanaerobaculia bacterium]|nr:hypothetical protein [Thermoanaerobaculia bacterium]
MSATPFRRLALLALALALATPWLVMAAPHPAAKGAIQAPSAPSSLLSLWSGWLTRLWADAGCIIDPDGRCATAPLTHEGCIADPSGRCATGPQTDAGCIIDPSGGCRVSQ